MPDSKTLVDQLNLLKMQIALKITVYALHGFCLFEISERGVITCFYTKLLECCHKSFYKGLGFSLSLGPYWKEI